MTQSWTYCLTGICFCAAGCYYFYKNSFEEQKKVFVPILLMIAGVILITIGSAKGLHLL